MEDLMQELRNLKDFTQKCLTEIKNDIHGIFSSISSIEHKLNSVENRVVELENEQQILRDHIYKPATLPVPIDALKEQPNTSKGKKVHASNNKKTGIQPNQINNTGAWDRQRSGPTSTKTATTQMVQS
ncbi:hypothetical protein ElyMa_003748700 [Elysia marginata]|uniref:Uncharacterized protein n=1 Tax=Elysia marginata TaxID=1093978 RepID=A0AAV4F9P8_9GAST|nr:hypothetical protein ElyMa_003748700 [Elysia marginata]